MQCKHSGKNRLKNINSGAMNDEIPFNIRLETAIAKKNPENQDYN